MIKNKFLNGFIMGLILPVLILGLLYFINEGFVRTYSNDFVQQSGFRWSTMTLMAVCANLAPTAWANRRRMDEFIRGIMFPTIIGSFVWFFYFDALSIF